MTTTYQQALEKNTLAIRAFAAIQQDYRARKIGDAEFLAGRAEYDNAMAEYDEAFNLEVSNES